MIENSTDVVVTVPKVAIIGRPNVGKSTLFNILTDSRKSVVKNQAGVTRDIIIEPCEIWGKNFDLIDTGGITEAHDTFSKLIREQVIEFLQVVDFLLVVMDGRVGLLPEDRELIRIAKESGKDFLLIINKVDRQHESDLLLSEFYEFGADLVSASFEQRRGIGEILEWVHKRIPEQVSKPKEGSTIALVGKPNVGKSSMVNALLGEHRMIVSDIAGTTVDAVDTPFQFNNKKYILVDTAGLRKSARRDDDIEIIAAFKSHDSIRKADIVLLMIDGTQGPTDQDARIMQSILEDHKAVIVVANKSDLGRSEVVDYRKTFQMQCEQVFHFYRDVPIVFTSAKTGYGIGELLNKIEWMSEKLQARFSTSELNDFFFDVIRKAPAPVYGITNVKFYYLTQTYQKPPSFIAFANHPDGVDNAYRRFIIKNLKDRFDMHGIPIRIFVMKSKGNRDG
ncbi:MAG: GTPase Der [Oligoflexia bacterium]|nr:MAG: GTPase Der [Oligoflexia bacterium]